MSSNRSLAHRVLFVAFLLTVSRSAEHRLTLPLPLGLQHHVVDVTLRQDLSRLTRLYLQQVQLKSVAHQENGHPLTPGNRRGRTSGPPSVSYSGSPDSSARQS
jgi:hypothetical protein